VFVPATSDNYAIIDRPAPPNDRAVHFVILAAVIFSGVAFAYLHFTLLDYQLNERLAKVGGTAEPTPPAVPPIADRSEIADKVSLEPGSPTAQKYWSMPPQAEVFPSLLAPRQPAPGPEGLPQQAAKSVK
jgi:hypothetical protein